MAGGYLSLSLMILASNDIISLKTLTIGYPSGGCKVGYVKVWAREDKI